MAKGPKPKALRERLLAKIIQHDGCWEWTGYVMPNGYAKLTVRGRSNLVHRLVYEEFVGPIPDGLDLDHTCHNADSACPGGWDCPHRSCVNPGHLKPATRKANLSNSPQVARARLVLADQMRLRKKHTVRRIHNRDKTHCPQGHPYDEENTAIRVDGKRQCRACDRERHNLKYASRLGGVAP